MEYASFWTRFAAWLIDVLIVSILQSGIAPIVAFGFIQPWYWWVNSFSNEPDVVGLWFLGTGVLLLILITMAYFVGFWVWRGQTPGKMAMRIKVVITDGSEVNAEKALLRFLGYFICHVLCFIPHIWVAVDSRRQGIHDKFAGTYVIQLPRNS